MLKMTMKPSTLINICAFVIILNSPGLAQHSADSQFIARVDNPAFTKTFPRVLFDEAHFNSETSNGRYKPFADLLFHDGYQIAINRQPFTRASLKSSKILIIVNPLGAEDIDDDGAEAQAFTAEECEIVHDWVRGGGALLLVSDAAPYSLAASGLSQRLGVEMSKGYVTDPANADKEANDPGVIVYSRENQLLTTHSITSGRSDAERVNKITVFNGQALKGPTGAEVFLKLADTAVDSLSPVEKSSAPSGRSQGVAFRLGKGRVVVVGDAAMLSAQVIGSENRPFGINTAGSDNKQLALNIMHWLSGLLK